MIKFFKFLSGNDFVMSAVPAILTAYSTFEQQSYVISVGSGVLVLFCFVIFSFRKNQAKYNKDLAQIIANGYFINFMQNLSNNLFEHNNEVIFEKNSTEFISLKNIKVRIYVPSSLTELDRQTDLIDDSDAYRGITIKNSRNNSSIWLRGRKEGNKLILVDYPRTLRSIPKFIRIDLGKEITEIQSKRYFKTFAEKIQRLKLENQENRILSKFEIVLV